MRWPLLDMVRSLRRGEPIDAVTGTVGVLLILLFLGTVGAVLLPGAWMARSHQPHSALWVLTQPLPFMYTLDNRWSSHPEGPADPEFAEACSYSGIRHHGPVGVLTSPKSRFGLRVCGLPTTITLTSGWLGHVHESQWRVVLGERGQLIVEPSP